MINQEILYHIYPLGLCDAPIYNDGIQGHRILRIKDWIEHLKKLGITAVYFGPIFESDKHGYDTRDYRKIDCRLGTNEDFKEITTLLHQEGIKVILDGVFNHVGRGFFAFQDVIEKKWDSPYKDWFHINFDDTNHQDGFYYQNWEGHDSLVKLNLNHPDVRQYLFDSIDLWKEEFAIDGLRLDVAYLLDHAFLEALSSHCKKGNPDFILLGEMIGGDYNVLLNHGCDTVTNYECRKGLYSAFNSRNLFEIAHSINRQFGNDPWTLYHGKPLVSFLDNHDVDRIASVLEDQRNLPLIYDLMFAMPGVPCIYYGSEWKEEGKRTPYNDEALRPAFEKPIWNDLCDHIASLCKMRKEYTPLQNGTYHQIYLQNEQYIFARKNEEGQFFYGLNINENPHTCFIQPGIDEVKDIETKKKIKFDTEITLDGKHSYFWYTKN